MEVSQNVDDYEPIHADPFTEDELSDLESAIIVKIFDLTSVVDETGWWVTNSKRVIANAEKERERYK